MKTPDFIKMLQEGDPKGECHVRLPGGIPEHVEIKEGYYDGPYTYIDSDGNFVMTEKGLKLDVYCTELEDFVWEEDNDDKKIIIDLPKGQKEKVEARIEKMRKKRNDCLKELLYEHTFHVLDMMRQGWKVVQPKSKPIGHYNVMWYVKDLSKFVEKGDPYYIRNKNQDNLCQGDCGAILESGLFEHIEKEGLIEWRLIWNT